MNKNDKEIIRYSNIHGISVTQEGIPTRFQSHWHNDAEFSIALKDGCHYKISDNDYVLEKDDIILIWPRELHSVVHIPERGSILIQFSSNIIENNHDIISATSFIYNCHVIRAKKEPELAGQLKELLYKIRDINNKNQYFRETKCKIYIYDILLLIGEHAIKEKREQMGQKHYSDTAWNYIRTACAYISEHSTENITQTEVASETGLSPYYFSKLFKEYTQMSFPAYLSGIRVQNAIALLTDNRLSITDCAFMSGFQSTTTFNKCFLEITGCSPREYRRMHSNEFT